MELFNLDSFSVNPSPSATPSLPGTLLGGEQEIYTILAVDDTPSNLHLIKRILRRQPQLSLITADGGLEALQILNQQAVDLILMDMMMPGMDGVETCQRIRALDTYAHIPIIFMTALDDTSSKVQGLAVAMDYLVKPFDAEEFLARVYLHLRLLSLTRQLQVRNDQLRQEIKERELAETKLQRRNRRLMLLNDIVDDIRSTLEPEQILAVAATKVGQALEADYCCIYTLREGGSTLDLEAEYLEASLARGGDQSQPDPTATPTAHQDGDRPPKSVGRLVSGLGARLPRHTPWMEARLTDDAVLGITTGAVSDLSDLSSDPSEPSDPQSTDPQSTDPQSTDPQSTDPQSTELQSTDSPATEPPAIVGSGPDDLEDWAEELPIPLPLQALLVCRASYRDRPNGLVLAGHYRSPRIWSEDDRELLGNVAAQLGVALNQAYLLKRERRNSQQLQQRNVALSQQEAELRSLNAQLHQWATRDSLTLLSNRRAFDEKLQHLWERPQTPNPKIGLLMCDVDYFKRYNDNYGHPAGDECLRRVAAVLKRSLLRGEDFAARYGGEEFVVVLPGTAEGGAIAVAQRILNLLSEEKIPHAYSDLSKYLTLSIGVACLAPEETSHPKVLLDLADQALYDAKSQGRNRYCVLNSLNL